MKSPALQSIVTSDSSRLMTSLGSAMMKVAQASCGRDATKVKEPSVASMSRHPDRETIYETFEVDGDLVNGPTQQIFSVDNSQVCWLS